MVADMLFNADESGQIIIPDQAIEYDGEYFHKTEKQKEPRTKQKVLFICPGQGQCVEL